MEKTSWAMKSIPFTCCNQSIAKSLVNNLLLRQQQSPGTDKKQTIQTLAPSAPTGKADAAGYTQLEA
jgi:hypothetical protein